MRKGNGNRIGPHTACHRQEEEVPDEVERNLRARWRMRIGERGMTGEERSEESARDRIYKERGKAALVYPMARHSWMHSTI